MQVTPSLTLKPVNQFSGTIHLPGSKSISNRALLLASLANGITHLVHLLQSDDVRRMLSALKALSVSYQMNEDETECDITGMGGGFSQCCEKTIHVGNAGTVMRFLTAALSLFPNDVVLTGDPRMLERPIHELVDALRQGGARIDYLGKEGYPPLRVYGGFKGGKIVINGSKSSQFLSALLMIAPLTSHDTVIAVSEKQVSQPYIEMTIKMIEIFGGKIAKLDPDTFFIRGDQGYQTPHHYYVEGDASAASYLLAGAAIGGGPVRVIGISKESLQGDAKFSDILSRMGAKIHWENDTVVCEKGHLKGIDADLNSMPDAAMTLAIVALFAKGNTTLRNIGNWRLKECDRLKAMSTELRKVGAGVVEGEDFITISPPNVWRSAHIETYNDHRMAMCFSLISLAKNTFVTIVDPGCTAKTFPDYFKQFAKLTKEA